MSNHDKLSEDELEALEDLESILRTAMVRKGITPRCKTFKEQLQEQSKLTHLYNTVTVITSSDICNTVLHISVLYLRACCVTEEDIASEMPVMLPASKSCDDNLDVDRYDKIYIL